MNSDDGASSDLQIRSHKEYLNGRYGVNAFYSGVIGITICTSIGVLWGAYQFSSGSEYQIHWLDFYDDLQGEAKRKYQECFAMAYLELKDASKNFCNITLTSETIAVELK